MNSKFGKVWFIAYANDNDALVPELWANESLVILEENMVAGNCIHRDFSNEIANFGDVVNTRKPAEFTAVRKTDADEVTIQDASVTNVPVTLNQHIHVSFLIKDGEESKSFKDLVSLYLQPAMLAQARLLDQIILGQGIRFRNYFAGSLGTDLTEDSFIDLDTQFNDNKVPQEGRNLFLTSRSKGAALKIGNFTEADKVGDGGAAMRTATVGQKYTFNTYMCQNTPYVSTGNTKVTGAINLAAGYAVGTTALTVDGFSAAISNGSFVTIAGDDTPHQVASTTGGATPTVITLSSPGLRRAVSDNAVVTVYTPGAVNEAAGYAAGYAKSITVDGFTVAPRTGQPVTFGTATDIYTIVGTPTTTSILLDRPLDAAISDNDKVNIGPAGNYNFACQRNALALVTRPLAMPRSGTGALSSTVSYNGFGMRAVITYNGTKQGHLVTLDVLAGIAVLELARGALLLG
jgi:hypothetical protein